MSDTIQKLLLALALLFAQSGIGAIAATTTVDLNAEASRAAVNDMARATLFAEATGAAPAEAARKVNALMTEALATARGNPRIKVQTTGTHTYPVYAKGGKIEAWRMRSEMTLESADTAALSELIGRLQGSLGVAGMNLAPAPETRKKAENEATVDAIAAFRSRAALIADTLGKPYRIKHLSIGMQGYRPPVPMLRAAPAAAAMEMAPMPLEAGESMISVTVSGQIEIGD